MKIILPVIFTIFMVGCLPNYIARSYNGAAWQIQNIPGNIECERYDRGGESVAYHDTDSINNGSGKLNPANGNYLYEFRMKEGVDISYTKSNNIDNNPFNQHEPVLNQLYVGWTQPGEWINYTVKVKETALYRVGIMYTANGDGAIALDVDGKQVATALKIPSTHNDADTVAWRQWHHWGKLDSLIIINITKGIQRQTFGSAPRTAYPNDLSDHFYRPDASGWGVAVAEHGIKSFTVIYHYDTNGNPMFITLPDSQTQAGGQQTGKLYRTRSTGSHYLLSTWNPADIVVTEVGTATLGANQSRLDFQFTVDGFSQQHLLTRLPF